MQQTHTDQLNTTLSELKIQIVMVELSVFVDKLVNNIGSDKEMYVLPRLKA